MHLSQIVVIVAMRMRAHTHTHIYSVRLKKCIVAWRACISKHEMDLFP